MDFINTLIKYRVTHGFYTKDYPKYANFIRSKRKEPAFVSEYFLSRYYISKTNKRLSNKYLKKAYKHSKTNEIYMNYISGIFHSNKNNEESLSSFMKARCFASKNFIFVKEIDERIEHLTGKQPIRQYIDWNGLQLEFVNEEEKLCFEERNKIDGNDYQTLLKNHIIKYNKLNFELLKCSSKNFKAYKNIYEKIKKLNECIIELYNFLNNNFVDNAFLDVLRNETSLILEFYENMLKYKKCDFSGSSKIDNFKVPSNYEYIKDAVEYAKNNKIVSLKIARELVFSEIEKIFECEENVINIPFLPVYYDLAYDYVQYPSEDEGKINKLLKGLSFFNK